MTNTKGLPLVSIDCLVYNHESYLRQCLDGFILQQTNFEIEIIIHDDASTDQSAEIIKEYTDKYPDLFFPIYQSENQYSKGVLIEETIIYPRCRGKYIALCEGDDYWTDHLKLQKQVDFLEQNAEYAGCAHQSLVLHDDNTPSHVFRQNDSSDITIDDVLRQRKFHTASIVFRQTIISNIKEFPKVISGDRFLIILVALSGKIKFMDECMCVYRKHAAGISSLVTTKMMKLDLNMVPFFTKRSSNFPKYRLLSFLYLTIAKYPKDIGQAQKLYYLFVSFIFSFSYFPRNLYSSHLKKVARTASSKI